MVLIGLRYHWYLRHVGWLTRKSTQISTISGCWVLGYGIGDSCIKAVSILEQLESIERYPWFSILPLVLVESDHAFSTPL